MRGLSAAKSRAVLYSSSWDRGCSASIIQTQAALATCQSVISAPAPFRLVTWVTFWEGASFIPNFRTTFCQFSWLFWMGTWVLNSADGQLHIDGPQAWDCKKENQNILEDILNQSYFKKYLRQSTYRKGGLAVLNMLWGWTRCSPSLRLFTDPAFSYHFSFSIISFLFLLSSLYLKWGQNWRSSVRIDSVDSLTCIWFFPTSAFVTIFKRLLLRHSEQPDLVPQKCQMVHFQVVTFPNNKTYWTIIIRGRLFVVVIINLNLTCEK